MTEEEFPFQTEVHMVELAKGPVIMEMSKASSPVIDRIALLFTNITGPSMDDGENPVFVECDFRIRKELFPEFVLRRHDPEWDEAITEAFRLYELLEGQEIDDINLEVLRQTWRAHHKAGAPRSEYIIDHAYVTDDGIHAVRYQSFHPKAVIDMEGDYYNMTGLFTELEIEEQQDKIRDLVDLILYQR